MTLLETQNLTVTIAGKTICRELNLGIQAGERWAILGKNGAGKSTLLHTLAGLRPPATGHVIYQSRDIAQWPHKALAQQRGLLFQDHHDPFPSTVLETALIGRHPHLGHWEWETEEDTAHAQEALKIMGLNGMESRLVNTLSGGERQRLAIATLLVQDPQLMLLDEPTNHLDLDHQLNALDMFKALSETRHKTMVMVLHDINLAARYCTHALLLMENETVLSGTAQEVITLENLERLYRRKVRYVGERERGAYMVV